MPEPCAPSGLPIMFEYKQTSIHEEAPDADL